MQPHGKTMDLEVCLGSERLSVGALFDDASAREDMRLSRLTLHQVAGAGLFAFKGEILYELEFHFPSREDWKIFLERPKAGGIEGDPELLERVLASDSPDDRIVVTEETQVCAYERVQKPLATGGLQRLKRPAGAG